MNRPEHVYLVSEYSVPRDAHLPHAAFTEHDELAAWLRRQPPHKLRDGDFVVLKMVNGSPEGTVRLSIRDLLAP